MLDEVALVTGKLNLDIPFIHECELVYAAANKRIHYIATPHQPPTRLFCCNWKAITGILAHDVGVVFQIDL